MSEDVKKKSFCDDCEEEAAACECYPFVLKAEKKIANLERQLKEAKEENGKLEKDYAAAIERGSEWVRLQLIREDNIRNEALAALREKVEKLDIWHCQETGCPEHLKRNEVLKAIDDIAGRDRHIGKTDKSSKKEGE
jgi:acyl-CoA reductase-like NAD-dependent aldehyde dehydrogenase